MINVFGGLQLELTIYTFIKLEKNHHRVNNVRRILPKLQSALINFNFFFTITLATSCTSRNESIFGFTISFTRSVQFFLYRQAFLSFFSSFFWSSFFFFCQLALEASLLTMSRRPNFHYRMGNMNAELLLSWQNLRKKIQCTKLMSLWEIWKSWTISPCDKHTQSESVFV